MPANQQAYPLNTLNALSVTATTATTTPTTGAIIVAGGVGISGNLNVAGSITGGSITYASTSTGTLAVTNTPGTTLTITSTEESTSVGTGSALFSGGVSIAKNLHVGGSITGGAIVYASTSTGTLAVTNSPGTTLTVASIEESTTQANGSMVLQGGVGVAKTINAGSLKSFDATQSTSTTTGSIISGGGVGASGNINAGGDLACQKITAQSSQQSTSTTTGALQSAGGLGVGGNAFIGGEGQIQKMVFTSSENSTSATTGSVQAVGGVGVGGSVYSLGQVRGATVLASDATNSTLPSNGSMVSIGGLGVALDLNCGGQVQGNVLKSQALTASTSPTTGSIISAGGVGVGGAVFASGNINGSKIVAASTEQSTSTTTGSLVGSGGIGVVGNAYVGGFIQTQTVTATTATPSTSTGTGSIIASGGVGVAEKLYVGGDVVAEANALVTGSVTNGGYDFILGNTDQVTRGDTGASRAFVKFAGGILVINFEGDFYGGIILSGKTNVTGIFEADNFYTETVTPTYTLSAGTATATDAKNSVQRYNNAFTYTGCNVLTTLTDNTTFRLSFQSRRNLYRERFMLGRAKIIKYDTTGLLPALDTAYAVNSLFSKVEIPDPDPPLFNYTVYILAEGADSTTGAISNQFIFLAYANGYYNIEIDTTNTETDYVNDVGTVYPDKPPPTDVR